MSSFEFIGTQPKAAATNGKGGKVVGGNSPQKGKTFPLELVVSMKAPQALLDKIASNPAMKGQIEKGVDQGVAGTMMDGKVLTLNDVINMYTDTEKHVDMTKNNPGGFGMTFERSNLYPDRDTLLSKGSPNPSILSTKKFDEKLGKDKTSNSDFVRMTDFNQWSPAAKNVPVSIEFNAVAKTEAERKQEEATGEKLPVKRDLSAGASIYFRVKANARQILPDQVAKAEAGHAAHPEYAIKKGYTVWPNSVKPSEFPTYQGIGQVQYNNSALLRDDYLEAWGKGNKAALVYKKLVDARAAKAQGAENQVGDIDNTIVIPEGIDDGGIDQ